MALEIRKNINKEDWDGFLSQFPDFNPFSQSFVWGDILLSEGKEVERLAIFDGDEQIAIALVVYEKMPFGWKYAFSPKGPVISKKLKVESYKVVMNEINDYLKEKKCVFWRLEPNIQYPVFNIQIVKVKDLNPPNTLILNLEKTTEELLSVMHSKTRYNIGLAKKKGLKIEERKDLEVFWDLMKRTGERDNFRLHNKKHYEEVLGSNLTSQVIIYFENKPIATGMFISFGQTFTYLYGASDYEYRQFMAPYLIQDFGINKAKNEGFKKYDFFGIAPVQKDENGEWIYDNKHQYAGVTRFKLGFGGEYIAFPGTFEMIISYKVYKVIKFIKSLRSLFKK